METNKINLITVGSKFEGTIEFNEYTRFEGYLNGTLRGKPGCEIIVGENGVVEGKVEGDIVVIDGYVRGNITGISKVIISGTGRVIGEIISPKIAIDFGGYFDGKCAMPEI